MDSISIHQSLAVPVPGGAEAIGPVLMGLNKPVHVLQLGSSVREIVNMITIAVVDAQNKK